MQVREILNREEWDSFLLETQPNTFLHSWEWKLVKEADGEHVATLGFYEQEELVAIALVITVHAKRGNHYLIPHGPILKHEKYLKQVLEALIAYNPACPAGRLQPTTYNLAVALRIAPLITTSPEHRQIFSTLGFRPAPMHVHAELTWVLDISKQEEVLLREMRKTTRNAITKAEKEGVKVEIIPHAKAVDRFWPLYEQTKDRHGFVPFDKTFIQSQAEIFGKENKMFFAIAAYEGKDVAAAMLIHTGNTVFYYHGASTKVSVPAAQLLQWEAIKEAKRRGAMRYNFWGISRDDEPHHPFAGITVFKKGFGGYAIDYMHAQDAPLSWKYWKLWAIEMWRKKKRGF